MLLKVENLSVKFALGKREFEAVRGVSFALEQGKDVWVIPGNIYSKNSQGTNRLISEGANIFIDIENLL